MAVAAATQKRADSDSPVKITFAQSKKDWGTINFIHVDELVSRLSARFSNTVIDRARGDEHIEEGLLGLQLSLAPEVILESHRTYFGNVAFVLMSPPEWGGAVVHGFLYSMWPPLGDTIALELENAASEEIARRVVQNLQEALDMDFVDPNDGSESKSEQQ